LPKKIIVIDLDGTFVSVNTFHKWMLFVAIYSIKKLAFFTLFKLLKISSLRAFKKINHAQMKVAILNISQTLVTDKDIKIFVKSLDNYVHEEILALVKSKAYISILATAAPEIYAKTLAEVYGFDYEISTPLTIKEAWKENLKEEKKKNVLLLLKRERLSLSIERLYTDHHDDLPLMKYAKLTYLINPSEVTLERVEEAGVSFV